MKVEEKRDIMLTKKQTYESTVPASIMAEASVTVEFSATARQGSTEPLTDVGSTTIPPLSVLKFSGRKDINWDSRW